MSSHTAWKILLQFSVRSLVAIVGATIAKIGVVLSCSPSFASWWKRPLAFYTAMVGFLLCARAIGIIRFSPLFAKSAAPSAERTVPA